MRNFRNVDFTALIDAGYSIQNYCGIWWVVRLHNEGISLPLDSQEVAWVAAQEHSGLPFIPDYHGAVKGGFYVETHPTRSEWLVSRFASTLHPEYAEAHIQKWFEASDRLHRSRSV